MKALPRIIQSKSDSRQYRAIELPNQIQCLLIRDQEAQKSSAALSVGIGSFKDPINTQGLAHYLQHMLFMGTEKYPQQNEYSNFITKYSGSNNAYTSQEQTNYQFQVSSGVFKQTLDRFAQFFIAPLMSEQSSEKQINAVHSEHCKNLNSDPWRRFQLSKHIAKKDHPYSKFSTGDKTTLANDNLKKMLHDFYNENYSSNIMKLVVYGKQTIQILESWVVQIFSAIPNKNYQRYTLPSQPYDDGAFGKLIKFVPVQDKKQLNIQWVLNDKKMYYKYRPGSIVSHLVGHQGKGSLFSFLMKSGLATALSSGSSDNYSCYSDFSISIELTQKGLLKVQQIIGYIKHYIEMIKANGIPQWCFEELQCLSKMNFDFMDKKKGMMQSASIASSMHKRKIQQIFIYPYLMQEQRPDLVSEYLSQLRSDNMIVYFSAKQHETSCNLEEPIYKTKYIIEKLPEIQPLKCEVAFPEKNSFIPKDLTVLPMVAQNIPEKIHQSKYIQAFFKQDHFFKLPKINLNLRLTFAGNFCPRQQVSRVIYAQMLNQNLREFTYQAQIAHIEASVTFVSHFSMQIKIKCYRDSLQNFLPEYLQKIFDFIPVDKDIYDTIIEKKTRAYRNYFLGDAYKLVYDFENLAMRANSGIQIKNKLQNVLKLTLQDVQYCAKNWKNKIFCQGYLGGNIQSKNALQIFDAAEKILTKYSSPLQKQDIHQIRTIKIQDNQISIIEHQLWNKQQKNSGVIVHFQTQILNIKSQMLHKLCESFYREPAFDFLRTKHQLGYIVFCVFQDHRGVGGIALLIQSGVKTSYELVTYIDMFMNQHIKGIIEQLKQQSFQEFKKALRETKSQSDKNLAAETTRYWSEIVKHKYNFERKSQQISAISQINLEEFKKFIFRCLYEKPKRLEIHANPYSFLEKNNAVKAQRLKIQEGAQVFKNIASFSKKKSLYPDFYTP